MEAELVAVVTRSGRNIPRGQAWEHIGALTLGNDVSCRDLQKSDGQWTRAKGFDTFGPCGPVLRELRAGEGASLCEGELAGKTFVEGFHQGARVQCQALGDMIFSVSELIEHISACMILEVGDLIFLGTPAGVTSLAPGEHCRVELRGFDLGTLANPVVARAPA